MWEFLLTTFFFALWLMALFFIMGACVVVLMTVYEELKDIRENRRDR